MIGARAYDAAAGRFVSRDPVFEAGDPDQMGGYTYAGNNPVAKSDPSGLRVESNDDGPDPDPSEPDASEPDTSGGSDPSIVTGRNLPSCSSATEKGSSAGTVASFQRWLGL